MLNDLMLQTYTGKHCFTLSQLKINSNSQFCIEVKLDQHTFEDFSPNKIYIDFQTVTSTTPVKLFVDYDQSIHQVLSHSHLDNSYLYAYNRVNVGTKFQMQLLDLHSPIKQFNLLQGQTIYLETQSE